MSKTSNLCVECDTSIDVFFMGRCGKCNQLWIRQELPWQKSLIADENKRRSMDESSRQTADRFLEHSKIVFGTIGLLYFIVMLSAQSDFNDIIIGWAIIGGIYLIFRFTSGLQKKQNEQD